MESKTLIEQVELLTTKVEDLESTLYNLISRLSECDIKESVDFYSLIEDSDDIDDDDDEDEEDENTDD